MHKAEGRVVRLALSPGRYEVIPPHRRARHRCEIRSPTTTSAVLNPRALLRLEAVAFGARDRARAPRASWLVQVALWTAIAPRNDGSSNACRSSLHDTVHSGCRNTPSRSRNSDKRHFASVWSWRAWTSGFRRDSTTALTGQNERFWWAAYSLGTESHFEYPVWRDRLIPYARISFALTYGRTSYQEIDAMTKVVKSDDVESRLGFAVRVGAGLAWMPWRHFGFAGELNDTYAPTVLNLAHDVHDSGGLGVLLGLRGER